jgi:hypothetical protein
MTASGQHADTRRDGANATWAWLRERRLTGRKLGVRHQRRRNKILLDRNERRALGETRPGIELEGERGTPERATVAQGAQASRAGATMERRRARREIRLG